MAASVRMRPSVFKSLYFHRTSCIVCRECQSSASTTTDAKSDGGPPVHIEREHVPRGQINIPKKKKRDSLSILKALASTVGRDPTAPKFVFLDDPALVPRKSEREKVLISKASGKRTARFMVNEYRNTFNHGAAAPPVKAYQPDVTEYIYTDVCTDALRERIARREVDDAIEVYNRLLEEGQDVSTEIKLSFLELLCVFGGKNPPPPLMPEERMVERIQIQNEALSFKIPMEFADEVFHSLPEKTVDAYNWIARGMAKAKLAKGLYFYQEMKKSEIPVYLGTYNELISYLSQQNVDRMKEVEDYLTSMKNDGIAPNLETFHSVLRALEYGDRNYAAFVPSVLAEMKVLKIEPTLQTFALVLSALRPPKSDKPIPYKQGLHIVSDIQEIITYMRARGLDKYRVDHPKEHFLFEALKECKKFNDIGVAEMLYNVREEMGYNYISTSFFEDENFFGTLLRMYALTENSDKLMEFYNKENTYNSSLTFPVILAVLDNIETHSAYQYLPQLWEDLAYYVKSKWVDKDLLQKFLDMFGDYNDNQKLREDFVLIAKELFEESKTTRNPAIEFNEIGNRLTRIFVNHKNLDLAWESAMYIYQNGIPGYIKESAMYIYQNGMPGYIKGELLRDVFEMSILEKDVPKIMSFCKLPSEARDTMAAAQVISDNRNILIECLDDSEMKELEEVFEV